MRKHFDPRRLQPVLAAVFWVLTFTGAEAARLTRHPSIWLRTETSVLIAWQTDVAVPGKILYGTTPQLDREATHPGNTVDHAVTLTDLAPGTEYSYRVVAEPDTLSDGSDSFRTAPAASESFRFLAFGDIGRATSAQIAIAARAGGLAADLAILTGDIIYENGEAANFTPQYFDVYRPTLRRIPFYPSLGNHDVRRLNGQSYLDAFHLPANNPAASERYYSFDYANAHFVALEAVRESTALPQAMLEWLALDLAAATARWKFVFFHIPIYSNAGGHGSDTVMRAQLAPILEAHGVDIVFQGHNHYYTRTYPIAAGVVVDELQDPDYSDPSGPIYIVTGGGGRSLYSLHTPTALEAATRSIYHLTAVDVQGDSLALFAVAEDGTVFDSISLRKSPTTAVSLEWLVATPGAEGIGLRWRVHEGGATSGYHVDRAIAGRTVATRLTLAPLQGGPELAFLDRSAVPGQGYRYVLVGVDDDGREAHLGAVEALWQPTRHFALGPARPTPFVTSVEIPFTLDRAAPVRAEIVDAAGRRVRAITAGIQGPGSGLLHWNGESDAGTRVAAGVYFIHLRAGERSAQTRVVLSR